MNAASEILRARFLYKALDAVLTAPLGPPVGRPGSRYERTRSLTRSLGRWSPRAAARLHLALLRTHALPFLPARSELLAYGAAATVLRVTASAPPHAEFVLKIQRESIGRSRAAQLALACKLERKNRDVAAWYAQAQDVFVPERALILQGHLLGAPAVACVQPFVGGWRRDFFAASDEELRALFTGDPDLGERFDAFARATLRVAEEQALCVDLVGAENLMLVQREGATRLALIDAGVFRLEGARKEPPEQLERTRARLARLARLLRR